MATVTPWATLISAHLAESRHAGLSWEDAKRAALAEHPVPDGCSDSHGWLPSTVKFAMEAFKDGYLRRGAGKVGALAERDVLDPSGRGWKDPAPRTGRFRCGSGEGCNTWLPERGLCDRHATVIDAIVPECRSLQCPRPATDNGYCAKHAHLAESNMRGSKAKAARLAA